MSGVTETKPNSLKLPFSEKKKFGGTDNNSKCI